MIMMEGKAVIEEICKRLMEYIEANRSVIKKAISIDEKVCEQNLNIDDIFEKIKYVQQYGEKVHNQEDNKTYSIGIVYNGQVDRTIEIAIIELCKKNNILFFVNDDMLATNTVIIDILNRIIKENKWNNFIKLYNKVKLEDIIVESKKFDKIICFEDEFKYEYIKKNTNIPVEFRD